MKNKIEFLIPVLLFSIWPFIGFYSGNAKEAPNVESLVAIYLIFSTPIFIFLAITTKFLKEDWARKIANASCIFIIFFFQYNFFKENLALISDIPRIHWLVWPPMLLTAMGLTLRFSGKNFTKIITTAAIVINIIPLATAALHILEVQKENVEIVSDDGLNLENTKLAIKPNIYHIILDAYAREDWLIEGFNYDNSEFIKSLKDRDFSVTPQSYSNYISTHISIPSTLQMNYPFIAGDKVPAGKLKLFKVTQGENRFVKFIKSVGYRYVHFQNGYYDGGLCRGIEDECIYSQKPRPLRDTERNFLKLTPSLFVLDKLFFKNAKFKSGVNEITKWKVQDSKKIESKNKPTYLYAHILNPHPPYLFQPDCSHRENAHEGMRDYSAKKYLTQVKCLSRQVSDLINTIQKNDENPIILIHADHGPFFGQPPLKANADIPFKEVKRRFAILNAFRLPKECKSNLYDSISPINSLRLIVSCLRGEEPNFIEDKHFLSKSEEGDTDHGYELKEVVIDKPKM